MTEESPESKKATNKKAATTAASKKPVKKTAAKASSSAASDSAGSTAKASPKKKAPPRERRKSIKDRRDHDKIMPGLLRNLQGVFDRIHEDNRDRDRTQEQMAEEFAVHLQRSFEEMHSQLEEREQLLDAKLKSIDRTHSYQLKRVKLMSIPVTVLSLVAVVYLFYVVRVMETAMTSMSMDMHQITAYMDTMSVDTHAMSGNTTNIYSQMEAMNRNIGNMNVAVNGMRYDVHNMSRTVSPAMSSLNRFMP
jgi:hypothetical protein